MKQYRSERHNEKICLLYYSFLVGSFHSVFLLDSFNAMIKTCVILITDACMGRLPQGVK